MFNKLIFILINFGTSQYYELSNSNNHHLCRISSSGVKCTHSMGDFIKQRQHTVIQNVKTLKQAQACPLNMNDD